MNTPQVSTDSPATILSMSVGESWQGDPALVAEAGFGWHAEAGMLLLVVEDIAPAEVRGLHGPLEVAVLACGPLVGLMVHLEGWGWQETWSWCRWSEIPEALTPNASGSIALNLVTVEQRTGVVQALRLFSLSTHASKVLRDQVRISWRGITDDARGSDLVAAWYAAHPRARDSLMTALARSKSRIG